MEIYDIIKRATDAGASDIHLTVNLPPMVRISGQIGPLEGYQPLSVAECTDMVLSLMNDEQKKKYAEIGEIDFSIPVLGIGRARINAYKQRRTACAAIRILTMAPPSIDSLNILQCFKEYVMKPRGLFLITGPTGSGKSTTLAAMIDYANHNRRCHILTIEDPIEYLYRHDKSIVNQREVGDDSLSFASALRAGLREDPDIILVGEMRDLETMTTALSAAETGHLVLSTVHTNSAPLTVDRIIDMFPPNQQHQVRVQLASVLLCIASQQLITRSDGSGRIPVYELLVFNDAVRAMIRDGRTHMLVNTMQTSISQGMMPMDYSLSRLIKANKITKHEALKHCQDSDLLERYLAM